MGYQGFNVDSTILVQLKVILFDLRIPGRASAFPGFGFLANFVSSTGGFA